MGTEAKTKRESEVWELINREKKRKQVNEEIQVKDWKKYFMRILGEVEGRVVRGKGRKERVD